MTPYYDADGVDGGKHVVQAPCCELHFYAGQGCCEPRSIPVTPYYEDEAVTLWHGDALVTLAAIPGASVDCIVTSPPYFGLRDYGVEGQYGLEPSPAEYVETMRAVFAEARRVLKDDGTLWLNIGDSYSGGKRGAYDDKGGNPRTRPRVSASRPVTDIPGKNLLGIPWRVAFALQDDGWILRNAIIWWKPNAMPESVTDRLSNRYEPVFLFSKSRRYWFDLDAIREQPTWRGQRPGGKRSVGEHYAGGLLRPHSQLSETVAHENGKNPGDLWVVPTAAFTEAHFACMAPALASMCVRAVCKPGGVVLDPFSGSGTTGLAATKLGRRYVGIDLNRDYLDLSLRTRLAQTALLDGTA